MRLYNDNKKTVTDPKLQKNNNDKKQNTLQIHNYIYIAPNIYHCSFLQFLIQLLQKINVNKIFKKHKQNEDNKSSFIVQPPGN